MCERRLTRAGVFSETETDYAVNVVPLFFFPSHLQKKKKKAYCACRCVHSRRRIHGIIISGKSQAGGTWGGRNMAAPAPELANEVVHLDSARSPDILATAFWVTSSSDAFN